MPEADGGPGRAGRGLTAMDGALALIVILLIVQMWLLTATLERLLAGHPGAALPGLVFSGLLLAGCVGLFVLIERLDVEGRRS